jgi:hypothetical protein
MRFPHSPRTGSAKDQPLDPLFPAVADDAPGCWRVMPQVLLCQPKSREQNNGRHEGCDISLVSLRFRG